MISCNLFIIACFVACATSRALYIPDELQHDTSLWDPEDFIPLHRRQDATCGGFSGLEQCGGSFPIDFCCSAGTFCLALNTSSSITAALCCPAGQDCRTINPINCSEGLQDASQSPQSQLHSRPTVPLEQCGNRCCPLGYACRGSVCVAQSAPQTASSSTSPSSTAAPSSTSTDTAEKNDITPVTDNSGAFSGKTFAAGFVPGLVIGGLIIAGIIFFCVKRRRRNHTSQICNEKSRSFGRDTLTDLGPNVIRRPMLHGRSISEPTANMLMGHRTEFLNSSPPHQKAHAALNGYAGTITLPNTPGSAGQVRQNGWLSHSPFLNYATSPVPAQPPLAAHMKRGTLAFQISPVRALRKQRSMHSLRRHVTSATHRSNSAASRGQRTTRSDSGETIQVLMSTPEHPPQQLSSATPNSSTYQPRRTTSAHQTSSHGHRQTEGNRHSILTDDDTTPTASLYQRSPSPVRLQDQTPTRPGKNSNVANIGASLQSPYSPSNYTTRGNDHLTVPGSVRDDERRKKLDSLWPPPAIQGDNDRNSNWRLTAATTFEGLMEKAGLRRSQMCMGPDPREWNR